jgi:hypothetical protein
MYDDEDEVRRRFFNSAIEYLLWSEVLMLSENDDTCSADDWFSIGDIDSDDLQRIEDEASAFVDETRELWEWWMSPEGAGGNWVLTRNRHGAGFWDGADHAHERKTLTERSHNDGSLHLYADGKWMPGDTDREGAARRCSRSGGNVNVDTVKLNEAVNDDKARHSEVKRVIVFAGQPFEDLRQLAEWVHSLWGDELRSVASLECKIQSVARLDPLELREELREEMYRQFPSDENDIGEGWSSGTVLRIE